MQPATARPFVSRRPPQSSPPPELEAAGGPIHSPSPADDTEHCRPTSDTTTMLAYLAQENRQRRRLGDIERVFRATQESSSSREVLRRSYDGLGYEDPFLPCWRFAAGHGVYLGPVPYRQISSPDDGLVLGPGSIALADGAQCSAHQQEDVAGAWEGWDAEERQVYTDVRAASLWVCREWFTAGGHDADECCGSLEIRLMCARYASNAVERFRQWRREVLK